MVLVSLRRCDEAVGPSSSMGHSVVMSAGESLSQGLARYRLDEWSLLPPGRYEIQAGIHPVDADSGVAESHSVYSDGFRVGFDLQPSVVLEGEVLVVNGERATLFLE